jgi:thiol-disulfide isomerase/thioredoxin
MKIKWTDIISETISIEEYLDKFKEKTEIINNFKNYKPKSKYLNKIKKILSQNSQKFKLLAMGAEWCHDCEKQVPSMAKIVKELNTENIEMRILYGIKVNVFRKEGEILWDKKHSPPEAVDPKFNLTSIPTLFLFKDDKFIGRIVEGPQKRSTLEKDLYLMLKKQF